MLIMYSFMLLQKKHHRASKTDLPVEIFLVYTENFFVFLMHRSVKEYTLKYITNLNSLKRNKLSADDLSMSAL